MSRLLISRNPELQQLIDEGFEIEIRAGHLLVHAVPYANSKQEVAYGVIVSELTTATPDVLARPSTHQVAPRRSVWNRGSKSLVVVEPGGHVGRLHLSLSTCPRGGCQESGFERWSGGAVHQRVGSAAAVGG